MPGLLLDTCVWIYLVTDRKRWPVLDRIEQLVSGRKIHIILPWVVEEEFGKNIVNMKRKLAQSYATHASLTRDVLEVLPDERKRDALRQGLDEVARLLKAEPTRIEGRIGRVVTLWGYQTTQRIAESDAIYAAVGKRACDNRQPRGPDAVIFESFAALAIVPGTTVYFITENVNDFSNSKDHRKPHADIASSFDVERHFSINIAEVLETVDPGGVNSSIIQHIDTSIEQVGQCFKCSGPLVNAGWRRSIGGLSWHHYCQQCDKYYDTGEFWD